MRTRAITQGKLVLCFACTNRAEGKKLMKLKGNDPVLEITHPDYTTITQSVTIEEGAVTSLSVTCT
jgi:hypothetical protein